MARPAPGSLAARTELRNPLSFFKKRSSSSQRGKGKDGGGGGVSGSSVGEVTIEIEPEEDATAGAAALPEEKRPPKASPLADYDTGPSASPSVTLSPTSSPGPGASSPSHSPQHKNQSPSAAGSPPAASTSQSQSPVKQPEHEQPSPKSDATTASAKDSQPSVAPPPASTLLTTTPSISEQNVVLRRHQNGGGGGGNGKTPLPPYVNYFSNSSSEDLKRYVLRNSRRRLTPLGGGGDTGKLLKTALNDHFERKKQGGNGSPALDSYVAEVFNQLDYHRRGTISREDFETLCEVIGISPSPPPSQRNSGLEWLSSYRPRPTSPASPIRVDRLAEVKYRVPPSTKVEPPPSPSSFLFTLGPRPFWELWPHKKRKRRRMTMDEFKKCLLEQWAKHRGIPQNRLSTVLPVHFLGPASVTGGRRSANHTDRIDVVDAAAANRGRKKGSFNGLPSSGHVIQQRPPPSAAAVASRDSRSRRFMRRVVRMTRRCQALDKISERLEDRLERQELQQRRNLVRNGSFNVRPCPVHDIGDGRRAKSFRHRRQRPTVGGICSPHCPNVEGIPPPPPPPPPLSGQQRMRRIASLEEQLRHQEAEISTLKDVVDDLRSSLQLTDAQNLALQVLLRKMARAEAAGAAASPSTSASLLRTASALNGNVAASSKGELAGGAASEADSFKSRMNESEKQLENLVRELKEMSKVKYPNIGAAAAAKQQSSTSSNNSFNGNGEDDMSPSSPVGATTPGRFPTAFKFRTPSAVTSGPTSGTKSEDVVDHRQQQQQQQQGMDIAEAYEALERAQEELNRMR